MQETKQATGAYSKSLLQIYDNCDPRHFHEVVTGDETWVHNCEPERKAQYRVWVPKEGNRPKITKEKSISEEGTVRDIQPKGKCVTKTT